MAARWCDDVCGFHRRLRGGAMMTEGEVIRHPGRWWQLCVAPYFADRGVGDMRGRVKVAPKSHPGGGARLSAVAVDALAASVAALLMHRGGSEVAALLMQRYAH